MVLERVLGGCSRWFSISNQSKRDPQTSSRKVLRVPNYLGADEFGGLSEGLLIADTGAHSLMTRYGYMSSNFSHGTTRLPCLVIRPNPQHTVITGMRNVTQKALRKISLSLRRADRVRCKWPLAPFHGRCWRLRRWNKLGIALSEAL